MRDTRYIAQLYGHPHIPLDAPNDVSRFSMMTLPLADTIRPQLLRGTAGEDNEKEIDLTTLNNDSPYSVMFGPDKCFRATDKVGCPSWALQEKGAQSSKIHSPARHHANKTATCAHGMTCVHSQSRLATPND